jgi:hypothetical protein
MARWLALKIQPAGPKDEQKVNATPDSTTGNDQAQSASMAKALRAQQLGHANGRISKGER